MQNGLPCNSQETDSNLFQSTGPDGNNGAKVFHPSYSITKYLIQDGSDMEDTWMTKIRLSIHSLMLIKTQLSHLESTQLLKKAEISSRKNGKICVLWFLNFYTKTILFIPMKILNKLLMNLIIEEFGSFTENICSN